MEVGKSCPRICKPFSSGHWKAQSLSLIRFCDVSWIFNPFLMNIDRFRNYPRFRNYDSHLSDSEYPVYCDGMCAYFSAQTWSFFAQVNLWIYHAFSALWHFFGKVWEWASVWSVVPEQNAWWNDGIIHIVGLFLKHLELCPKTSMVFVFIHFSRAGGGHGPRHPCLSTVVAIQEFNHLIRDPAESCASWFWKLICFLPGGSVSIRDSFSGFFEWIFKMKWTISWIGLLLGD